MNESLKESVKRRLKTPAKNLYWKIYGKTIKNPRLPDQPNSILFVCKGNICRSPYAEYSLTKLVKERAWQRLRMSSAGLIVPTPQRSPDDAVLAAEQLGVDMNLHMSRSLTHELVSDYDIILAMEAWQVRQMKKQYPQFSDKFFLLPLFDPLNTGKQATIFQFNIEDPYGKSRDCYHESFRRIERCIESLIMLLGNI